MDGGQIFLLILLSIVAFYFYTAYKRDKKDEDEMRRYKARRAEEESRNKAFQEHWELDRMNRSLPVVANWAVNKCVLIKGKEQYYASKFNISVDELIRLRRVVEQGGVEYTYDYNPARRSYAKKAVDYYSEILRNDNELYKKLYPKWLKQKTERGKEQEKARIKKEEEKKKKEKQEIDRVVNLYLNGYRESERINWHLIDRIKERLNNQKSILEKEVYNLAKEIKRYQSIRNYKLDQIPFPDSFETAKLYAPEIETIHHNYAQFTNPFKEKRELYNKIINNIELFNEKY